MSLLNYKPHFDNAYQEIFQKILIGKSIANLRFEKTLKYGESVERVSYSIDKVRVRTVNRSGASVIDAISDTPELLTINVEKEAVFYISDGEVTQAGPLNPGEVIGGKVAHKVATDLDARILAEVVNAGTTFDAGDLTTGVSTGVPVTSNATNVPLMVTRMPAKLRSRHQVLTNLAWVIDSYMASDIETYLMTKNIDIAGSVFKNGYAGETRNAVLYVSENLLGEAVVTLSADITSGDTIVINGVEFKFVTALSTGPAVAGEIILGANVAASRANLVAALTAPSVTTAKFTALSGDDLAIIEDMGITAVDTVAATTVTIKSLGSGRLVITPTMTSANNKVTSNFIHSYYGKKGAIDVVVQDLAPVDMRKTSDRRGTNVFSSYLAGIKTFTDGKAKFLDVKIAV